MTTPHDLLTILALLTSHAFLAPTIVVSAGTTLVERAAAWDIRERTSDATVAAIQAKIDDLAFRLYGVDGIVPPAVDLRERRLVL